ncbi:hypothetical protein [Streptomyces sp. ME01-18h]|uniref:hypothetical protein n=1 Tax=Streptomyces sp. ME01-18h TaxID=462920 RepID=UPI0029A35077|nr:hypothetical protein [Streptomyces sp. ME01-18h]MDX3404567.1 hypothetical protein [Streptomyces sp. ME01-18h]
MTDPSKVAPTCRACNQNRTGRHRLSSAVQIAGRMLCWSLAAGMAAAAADILAAPQAGWWPYTWPVPWYLVCLSALAWALLRAREKNADSPPSEDDDELCEEEWEKAA